MRTLLESRGILASFMTAVKRSSIVVSLFLIVAFSAARAPAFFLVRRVRRLFFSTMQVLAMLSLSLRLERHIEGAQQFARFVVGFGGGADNDVHATDFVDFVVVD